MKKLSFLICLFGLIVTMAGMRSAIASNYTLYELGDEECVEVEIDIKPGRGTKRIRIDSMGMVPVAILGDEMVNPNNIDVESVTLAGAAPMSQRVLRVDVNRDGLRDLLLFFSAQDLELVEGENILRLEGNLMDEEADLWGCFWGEQEVVGVSRFGIGGWEFPPLPFRRNKDKDQ